ncbi:hypothetical protein J2S43_006455 [Catenuloplanes nepalensis]|uniref:DUF304 domain-containing protein n=1 Tax=Catenuloplanes nepalensis TaxID=587533 RepID=A0ABT9N365_9ACTN|nr:hypothetical protein [Catenuloplanes nepalensis]MDP9797943.1 hypothetical protein [Catenuloplanes nepalensis]
MSTVMRLAAVLAALGLSALAGWAVRGGADLSCVTPAGVLLFVGGGWALRQRERNRPMRWLPAIRLPGGGTAAGLVAPLSRPETVAWLLTNACFVVWAGGVAGWLAESGGLLGPLLGALAVAAALWGAHRLWANLPALRRTAIVEAGVRWQGRLIPWAEIESVRLTSPVNDDDEGDVELRTGGRSLDLTPPGTMIDPAELRLAVVTYLRAPERRPELRSPVDPRGDVVLPPDPRLGRHTRGETVERGPQA